MSKFVELEVKPENSGSIVAIPVSTTGSDGKATSWGVRDEKGTTLMKVDATAGSVTLAALAGPLRLPVYANDTARDVAVPAPVAGMIVANQQDDIPIPVTVLQFHDGSVWATVQMV